MNNHKCTNCGNEWKCYKRQDEIDCGVPDDILCSICAEKLDLSSLSQKRFPKGCHASYSTMK